MLDRFQSRSKKLKLTFFQSMRGYMDEEEFDKKKGIAKIGYMVVPMFLYPI